MTRIRVPLGKFIKEYSERNKGNEDIPVYSVTNSQGFCTEYFGKEVASQDKTTYKIVPQGYFAYNPSRINVGSVDWQRYEKRVIVSPLYNVFSVSEGIDRQYLYYFLRSDLGRQMIKAKASGSVRDNLKLDMLKEMTIPDISVEQQKFCSSVLDKLHKLIQMRQQELQKLDEFIKARFIELFGNPVSNPKGWERVTIDECVDSIDNGKSFVCDSMARMGEEPAILKLSAATYGVYKPEENKAIINGSDFIKGAEVHSGDLLFTRKNTPELVGMAAYVFTTPKKLMMPDLIFRINTKQNCRKIYLWKLINHELFRSQIQSLASGSAKSMSNISKERLGKLHICLPPLDLQIEFEEFVIQINKSKVAVQKY